MKVKEIYVEAAKTKNYQKYTVGFTVQVDEDDSTDGLVKCLQDKARKLCNEQIELDTPKFNTRGE